MTFGCLYLNQKIIENISAFLPYLSRIGQIKKESKELFFYDLTHFRG
jgi:hypothetical protein